MKKEPFGECHKCGEILQEESDNYGHTQDECCLCKDCQELNTVSRLERLLDSLED